MKVTKDTLRELIKQVIDEMSDDEIITSEIVSNTTANVAGYDGPLQKKPVKRKLSKKKDKD